MKRLMFVIIVLAGMLSVACSSAPHPEDRMFGRDKLYHFTASAAIGAGATLAAANNGHDTGEAPVIGFTTAVTIGGAKEAFDAGVKQTYWSWKDLFWDAVGAAAGCGAAASTR